jgi:dTDP-glucose 4,6-dehydratase
MELGNRRDFLSDLSDQRILITGGTGFFGRSILRHWLAEKKSVPKVYILTRNPQKFLSQYPEFSHAEWLSVLSGDVLKPTSLPRIKGVTHLLHAATDSQLSYQLTPLERYTQIVNGTRHMLDFAVEYEIPRFLFTSSGGVYGPQPKEIELISENFLGIPDPLVAQNAYSVAKRCAEHLCAIYRDRYGIQTVIARCFAFVGRDLPLNAHFAIGNFIQDALIAPEITINSDGSSVRSYMDQRDLANWLVKLLERGKSGEAYNVGSDMAITIRELAYLVRDILAPKKTVCIKYNSYPENFRNRYVPSIVKAREEFGLDLNFTLTDSLHEVAKFAARFRQITKI